MKLFKYILIVGLVGFILISVLTRVPAVQDRLMFSFIQSLGSSTADLNDNSLSAVVCGSRSPIPSPGRAQTCILINAGGNYYVVDIGDGSANNLNNWRIDAKKLLCGPDRCPSFASVLHRTEAGGMDEDFRLHPGNHLQYHVF